MVWMARGLPGVEDEAVGARVEEAPSGIALPHWVLRTTSDAPLDPAGRRLRVLEVFTQLEKAPSVAWDTQDRARYLVIPNPHPAGWTPVAPLAVDCPALHWYNRPPEGQLEIDPATGHLSIHAARGTNFWQAAQKARCRDDAHFLHLEMPQYRGESLALSGRFRLESKHAGDQAGVLIRRGAAAWAGLGITATRGGAPALTAAVTNEGRSDASIFPCPALAPRCEDMTLRITVTGDAVEMEANPTHNEDPAAWALLRTATLYDAGNELDKSVLSVGTYAAAPEREGMVASVAYFAVVSAPAPLP